MIKHIGSTLALIVGVLSILSGLTKPGGILIMGMVIVLGALAYRSVKKRKLGEVSSTQSRAIYEASAIVVALLAVLLQNNVVYLIQTDPVPNLIVPIWVLVAYVAVLIWKPKNSTNEKA